MDITMKTISREFEIKILDENVVAFKWQTFLLALRS